MARFSAYGKFLAVMVNHVIGTLPDEDREAYRSIVRRVVEQHSFKPHKEGTPRRGDYECKLGSIIEGLDITDPEHVATGIIEAGNAAYNTGRANHIKKAFLDNL